MLDNMLFDLPSFINLVLSGLIGVVTSWAITYVYSLLSGENYSKINCLGSCSTGIL